ADYQIGGMTYWPQSIPQVGCGLQDLGFTVDDVYAAFEALRQENLAIIEQTPVTSLLPTVKDTKYDGDEVEVSEGPLSHCQSVYLSTTNDARGFVSLVSFALDKKNPVRATTINSMPGAVYATSESLYLAVRHRKTWGQGANWMPGLIDNVSEATSIHKFDLDPKGKAADYVASGVVKGRVLNQFAMSEHDDVLRIATTTGRLPSPSVHSTITT
ncbi:MAG: beta-propeller domain-containing protein, partial [Myxococcales bacterium]|nr:beta-propeller domain-containing protein [Myxococcales bacterium]